MFGKLLNFLVAAAMLAALGWHYRDTDAVRQRRPLIESTLKKLGLTTDQVRRYWPVGGAGSGQGLTLSGPDAAAQNNPIERARKQINAANQAQRDRDAALEQVGK